MFVFKILLIILVSLPVIAASIFCYGQVLVFVRGRNREEVERAKKAKAAARAARAAERAERAGER